MFGNIFGMGAGSILPTNQGAGYNAAAQQQLGAYNYAQAQAAQQAYQQNMQNHWRPTPTKKFMINGVYMDLDEFLDELYPVDCSEKTMIRLKYTGEQK